MHWVGIRVDQTMCICRLRGRYLNASTAVLALPGTDFILKLGDSSLPTARSNARYQKTQQELLAICSFNTWRAYGRHARCSCLNPDAGVCGGSLVRREGSGLQHQDSAQRTKADSAAVSAGTITCTSMAVT